MNLMREKIGFLLLAGVIGCGVVATEHSKPWQGTAIDGDTFTDEGEHYRLARIDAPELPGHCRVGRHCVSGDPYAARARLQVLLNAGLTCRREGLDYYRRILVECWTPEGTSVNEQLVAEGYATWYRRS